MTNYVLEKGSGDEVVKHKTGVGSFSCCEQFINHNSLQVQTTQTLLAAWPMRSRHMRSLVLSARWFACCLLIVEYLNIRGMYVDATDLSIVQL